MAARLPLIVSQPARRDASAVDLIESIVAGALLVPKLDANLVGDIASIESGSTDHLCLQGHTRDVILASYLEAAEAVLAWQRLGQSGCLIDCSQSTQHVRSASLVAGNQRRIFYFQLTAQTRIPALLSRCQELVDAQSTQLVSIGLGTGQPQPPPGPVTANHQPKPLNAKPLNAKPLNAKPLNTQPQGIGESPRPPHKQPLHQPHIQESDEREWAQLDKLVDDLDSLDL